MKSQRVLAAGFFLFAVAATAFAIDKDGSPPQPQWVAQEQDLQQQGKYKEAMEVIMDAAISAPDKDSVIDALCTLGCGTDSCPAPEINVAACQEAAKLLPKSPKAHIELGRTYSYIGHRYYDAIGEYRKAIALDPTYQKDGDDAYSFLAGSLWQLNRHAERIEVLRQSIKALKTSGGIEALTLLEIARSQAAIGEHKAALETLKQALELKPDQEWSGPGMLWDRAQMMIAQAASEAALGRYAAADADWKAARSLRPDLFKKNIESPQGRQTYEDLFILEQYPPH